MHAEVLPLVCENVASKSLLGNVANEPCAVSVNAHRLVYRSKQPQRQPVEAVSAWQAGECGLRWDRGGHDRPYRPNNDGFNTGHAGPPACHVRMLKSVNSYEEVRDSNPASVRPIPTHVWRWSRRGELPAGAQADGGGPAGGRRDLADPERAFGGDRVLRCRRGPAITRVNTRTAPGAGPGSGCRPG